MYPENPPGTLQTVSTRAGILEINASSNRTVALDPLDMIVMAVTSGSAALSIKLPQADRCAGRIFTVHHRGDGTVGVDEITGKGGDVGLNSHSVPANDRAAWFSNGIWWTILK